MKTKLVAAPAGLESNISQWEKFSYDFTNMQIFWIFEGRHIYRGISSNINVNGVQITCFLKTFLSNYWLKICQSNFDMLLRPAPRANQSQISGYSIIWYFYCAKYPGHHESTLMHHISFLSWAAGPHCKMQLCVAGSLSNWLMKLKDWSSRVLAFHHLLGGRVNFINQIA